MARSFFGRRVDRAINLAPSCFKVTSDDLVAATLFLEWAEIKVARFILQKDRVGKIKLDKK